MSLVGEWDIIGTTRENSSIYISRGIIVMADYIVKHRAKLCLVIRIWFRGIMLLGLIFRDRSMKN